MTDQQPTLKSTPQGKQPAGKVEDYFPLVAAIWRNENAEGRVWYSTTIERRYKDQSGAWQSSGSFDAADLLLLQKVAGLAHTEAYRLMRADRQAAASRDPGQDG